jgi:hypothetical protein
LAVPQNCRPYDQIGFISDLYINNLVFKLEHLLFVIKFLSERKREFKINLFDLICWFQVSLLSSMMPRYFTELDIGIGILSTVTGGQESCLREKVVWTDLLWLSLILHLVYHCESLSRWDCKLAEAVTGFSWIEIIALSSA